MNAIKNKSINLIRVVIEKRNITVDFTYIITELSSFGMKSLLFVVTALIHCISLYLYIDNGWNWEAIWLDFTEGQDYVLYRSNKNRGGRYPPIGKIKLLAIQGFKKKD